MLQKFGAGAGVLLSPCSFRDDRNFQSAACLLRATQVRAAAEALNAAVDGIALQGF